MSTFLEGLNPAQKEAVTTTKGPLLIIAGAGSGKTKALTHRIAYLVHRGVAPHEILAVTFTNKAAQEMLLRLKDLLRVSASSYPAHVKKALSSLALPFVGTFHALCADILRKEIELLGYTSRFLIYDSDDQIRLMKRVLKDLAMNPAQFHPARMRDAISSLKDELITVEAFEARAQHFFERKLAEVYRAYQTELKKRNAVDFDDLLFLMVRLFRAHPQRLMFYQKRFKYILVDEYQDTNHAQYILVNLLAQRHRNICVVGDDWQSIYGWRGADFRNILNFTKDYPDAKTIFLEQNYRSTKTILDAAHAVIQKNVSRTDKQLWTENPAGSHVVFALVPTSDAEADYVASTIQRRMEEEGREGSHFAVLYRTNAQSRALEEAFLQAGIPYKIIGNVRFYERKEVKDVLAYLRLVAHAHDYDSFERVANVPQRGIGKETLRKFTSHALPPASPAGRKMQAFLNLVDELRNAAPGKPFSSFIELILRRTEYEEHLIRQYGKEEGESRWENVLELLSVAKKYDAESERTQAISKFLEEIALMSDQDEVDERKPVVHLMTLHAAKGLEFPVVFITGFEEGVFPHSRSLLDPAELEEERRLCYVGITRAKEEVHLCFARTRLLHGSLTVNPPSRFLADIPPHLVTVREYDGLPSISLDET